MLLISEYKLELNAFQFKIIDIAMFNKINICSDIFLKVQKLLYCCTHINGLEKSRAFFRNSNHYLFQSVYRSP